MAERFQLLTEDTPVGVRLLAGKKGSSPSGMADKLPAESQIETCTKILNQFYLKSSKSSISSLSLKQQLEKLAKELHLGSNVSNGACIAAAKKLGFRHKHAPSSSHTQIYARLNESELLIQKQKNLKIKIKNNDYLKNAIVEEFPSLAPRVSQFADFFDDKRYAKFVLSFKNDDPPFRELALDAAEEAKTFQTFRELINLMDMEGSTAIKKVAIENFLEYRTS